MTYCPSCDTCNHCRLKGCIPTQRDQPEGKTTMDSITITKDQLRAALETWEQDFRDGKTMTPAEVAAMPTGDVAEASAHHLWLALSNASSKEA